MEKNTKKANLKKRDRLVFLIIAVVVVVAVIVCVVMLGGNDKTTNNGENTDQPSTENSTNNGITGTVNEHLDGQIDYTKTENVEIKDNVKENNSGALLKEKMFEGMKVKDIKLTASNGTTKFLATVENTTD